MTPVFGVRLTLPLKPIVCVMSFSWIPFGYHRSWSFNIGVKAASLSDLKYDKSQSMYDNMY